MEFDIWDRLTLIMNEERYDRVVYVYRLGANGNPVKPYLAKLDADRYLLDTLRDEFDGGDFHLMIRQDRKLIFTGNISIYRPALHVVATR